MLTACPATPVSSLGTLADSATLGTPLHSLRAPLLSPLARGYRRCSPCHPLAHGFAVLRSRKSPSIDSARAQHPAWNKFKARCCRTDNSGIDEHKRNRYCVSDALTHVIIITAQCQNRPAYSALMKVVFGLAPQGGWGIPRGKEGKFFPFQPFNWLIISQSHFSRCEQFSLLTKTRPKSYTLTCSYSYFYGIPKIKSQMLKFRLVFLPRYQRDTKGHMFCLGIRNQPEKQAAI